MGSIDFDEDTLDDIWKDLSDPEQQAIERARTAPYAIFSEIDDGIAKFTVVSDRANEEVLRLDPDDSQLPDAVKPGDEVWLTVEDGDIISMRYAPALSSAFSKYRNRRHERVMEQRSEEKERSGETLDLTSDEDWFDQLESDS